MVPKSGVIDRDFDYPLSVLFQALKTNSPQIIIPEDLTSLFTVTAISKF
jgi:hypothetical protein